jgi:glycosyltransferase involved in cell wall biosynthesis
VKVLILVNGSPGSAAAARANEFAGKEGAKDLGWQCSIAYRPTPKWRGIHQFLGRCVSFQPDLVYVMDTAYAGVLAACAFKAFTGCPFIVDTGDAAFALASSTGNYSPLQLRLIQGIERAAITYANAMVARGTYHRPILESAGATRVEVIPDGVNVSAFQNIPSSQIARLRQQLRLDDHLVLGVVGTMEWSDRHQFCYGWDIVEAMVHLRDLPVKALLIGDGSGWLRLQERAREMGVAGRIVFTGRIAIEEIGAYVSVMDVCVSAQSNDQVGWVRTTGKLPLYLACGRYVIATDVGEAHRVLGEVGHLLPYSGVRDDLHPRRLAGHVRTLTENPALLARAQGAIAVAKREFDYGLLKDRMKNFCADVIASTRGGLC